jgi:hypothetical protein
MLGNRNEGVYLLKDKEVAYFAVGGRADVLLRLRTPVSIERMASTGPPITTIYVAVDDPARFAGLIQERLAAAPPESEPVPSSSSALATA